MLIGVHSAKTLSLVYYAMWNVDVGTGVVSVPTSKMRYEAEGAEILGGAGM